MRRNLQSVRFGLPAFLMVLVSLPFMMGQGCGGTSLAPVNPTGNFGTETPPTSTNNISPFFEFIQPSADVSVEVGRVVTIQWTDSDPDNNAAITLVADPDNIFGNGNERVILPLVLEDDLTDLFDLDTSILPIGTYRIIARVNDNVNPELIAVAPGRILLIGAGGLPGNKAPIITMTDPEVNLSLAQGDQVTFSYCGGDVDDGLNVIPDVIILLDTDQNSKNDLNLTGPNREAVLLQACSPGPFPRLVSGVYVLGCAKDDDCVIPVNGNVINVTLFPYTEDVGLVPSQPGGAPY